jgi:hypothetical protein
MYLPQARATSRTRPEYPIGDVHALIIYISYKLEDQPDFEVIRSALSQHGWET